MRRGFFVLLWAVLLCAAVLSGAQMRVDHVTIAGSNLEALRRAFAGAGLSTEYGGRHSNGITEMALSSFADGSYLELIAPVAGADPSPHYWGAFMKANAGPCAWAVRSANLASDTARLSSNAHNAFAVRSAAAGIAVEVEKAGRRRADGVELKWATARIGPPPQGSFFPFMIADETPRDLRAFPSGKPTAKQIKGVLFVVVAVPNLAEAISKYRSAFDLPAPVEQEDPALGARLAGFPGSPAILAAPTGDHTWLRERLKQFGAIPCAFVFEAPDWNAAGTAATWFGRKLVWLEGSRLGGAKIAIAR
jgi:Glyoxalase-like domain